MWWFRSRRESAGALAVALAAALGAAGCPGARAVQPRPRGPAPLIADPPPPLPAPPRPDPDTPGLDYLERVHAAIGPAWHAFLEDCRLRLPRDHELNRMSLEARLRIELDRRGRLVAAELMRSSGAEAFDQAALEVVRDAAPLPAPPPGWLSDDGRAHLEWSFARDARQAGAAGAAIRKIEWPLDRAIPALIARGQIREAARRVASAAAERGAGPADEALLERFRAVCAGAVALALAEGDPARQRVAIAAAEAAGLTAAAPRLRALAKAAVDPEVRRAAARALGAIGDREAIPLLSRLALEPDPAAPEDIAAVAAAALVALGREIGRAHV